jgi:predicted RecB family endonuclease
MAELPSLYDTWFHKLTGQGAFPAQAAITVIHRYLDGKSGAKTSPVEIDAAFWSSVFWQNCPDEVFRSECFVLAFAKYLGRDGEQRFSEIPRALAVAPDACKRALRYSRVFLSPESGRWRDLQGLISQHGRGYKNFIKECREMWRRYEQRRQQADAAYGQLSDLSILDLLVYASISAFKTELPLLFDLQPPNALIPLPGFRYTMFTEAVGRLLARRLGHCGKDELDISEESIRVCFRKRMYPLLLARHFDGGTSAAVLKRFEGFIDAQIRLDHCRHTEIGSFCFDGAVSGQASCDLSIEPVAHFEPWMRSCLRGHELHQYWQLRSLAGLDESAGDDQEHLTRMAQEGHLKPSIRILADMLMLHDLFGVDEEIDVGNGVTVNLQRACLALELAKANFEDTLLAPFLEAMRQHGDWASALVEVIESGMRDGGQQRYPVLFARTAEKLQILRQFTVSEASPSGSEEAAAALLAFFGNDLKAVRDHIHQSGKQLKGNFAEQPFLKLGDYVFTLPWVLTTQNNATALVNNLRRVRSVRPSVAKETKRIEERLAEQMQQRGFRTLVGYEPPDGEGEPAGEVDLLASRDGHLFVFEIKSGYVRQTLEAAWLHRTNTLRKAGRQLARKLAALVDVLPGEGILRDSLQLEVIPSADQVHSWTVDTSIDFDRQRFSGHLKVSMTEVLIVLRDEAGFLAEDESFDTLYPDGFSASRFAQVIEQEVLWRERPNTAPLA